MSSEWHDQTELTNDQVELLDELDFEVDERAVDPMRRLHGIPFAVLVAAALAGLVAMVVFLTTSVWLSFGGVVVTALSLAALSVRARGRRLKVPFRSDAD